MKRLIEFLFGRRWGAFEWVLWSAAGIILMLLAVGYALRVFGGFQ